MSKVVEAHGAVTPRPNRIVTIRGKRVILDADFCFVLSPSEWKVLKVAICDLKIGRPTLTSLRRSCETP